MILQGLYKQLLLAVPVTSLLGGAATAAGSIYENVAIEQPPASFIVLNRAEAPPAGATLDGISDLIEGELQFDSYAPNSAAAKKLSLAVRDYLMKTFNAGALPEGSTVQFVDVTMDHDEPYELGGAGLISRAMLRLKAFYTESLS